MTCPLGKLGSLITRITLTSFCVGRGRLMRRFTIAFKMVEEDVKRIKMASRRKRSIQKREATPIVCGTDHLAKPISETAYRKRLSQGLRCFCRRIVIAMSPGKNWVRRAISERIMAPESNQR